MTGFFSILGGLVRKFGIKLHSLLVNIIRKILSFLVSTYKFTFSGNLVLFF